MKSVYYLIASNQPKDCTRSLKILTVKKLGVEPDKIKLLCHKSQIQDFKDSLTKKKVNKAIEIFGHDFGLAPDGKPPFGALRWYGMELLKRYYMSDGDAGVLLDDDIVMTRYILPNYPTKRCYDSKTLDSKVYTKKLQVLIETAEAWNIPYFTTGLNYKLKNSYDWEKPLIRTYKWTGFFGFFKWSENPFDKAFSVGADGEAQFKIVFNSNALNVLQDTGLILATEIQGGKYRDAGEHNRRENYAIIDKRYPGITTPMDHNSCRTRHLHLKRKILNQLKENCVWRLRGNDDESWLDDGDLY